MAGAGKPITLSDVARQAGVTSMTISRFLRSPEIVSEATRKKIAETIERLGYVPDAHAARLAGKERPVVSVVVPSLELPYFAGVFRGVADYAEALNAAIMVAETTFDAARQESVIHDALSWRPNCVIYLGNRVSDQSRHIIEASSARFVETWDLNPEPLDISVGISNRAAAADAVGALLAAGYRRVGFAVRRAGHRIEDERLEGYREGMRRAGEEPLVYVTRIGGSGYAAGAVILDDLAASSERPDAVLFAGDMLALGAMFAARRQGIRIPHDLAVVGFGDYDVAEHSAPRLSTVRIPGRAIGFKAVEIGLSPDVQRGHTEMIEHELVERDSARFSQ